MSNLRLLSSIVFFSVISTTSFSRELTFDKNLESAIFSPAIADRLLLIGFTDRHINRIQNSASPTNYRRRGTYKSSTWGLRITSRIEEKYGLQKLTEWPMTEVGMHCAVFLAPPEASVDETVKLLSKDPRIDIVQKMNQFKTEGHRYNDPYYRLQSNMHLMEIEQAHVAATGKNVTIAVIDTGMDTGHPDLAGQIKLNKNFVSGASSGFSGDMHGTAVAGLIAARKDNKTGIIGVAPDAKIVALKACWSETKGFQAICNSFTLALAVNKALRSDAKVLNMSLTGPEDPLLGILLEKAKEKGIFVVAADPGEKYPGNRFPASMESVIPVQAPGNGDFEMADDSRTIVAPGDNILTTLPHGTYDFVSGSSLAAAEVSGVVALMLELNPDLYLEQTKTLLRKSIIRPHVSGNGKPRQYSLNAGMVVRELCKEMRCSAKLP